MLSPEQINDLHRLYRSERWPIRKIERHLCMSWHTIRKYLDAPAQGPAILSWKQALPEIEPVVQLQDPPPRVSKPPAKRKEERLIYRISIITECPQEVAFIASSSP